MSNVVSFILFLYKLCYCASGRAFSLDSFILFLPRSQIYPFIAFLNRMFFSNEEIIFLRTYHRKNKILATVNVKNDHFSGGIAI